MITVDYNFCCSEPGCKEVFEATTLEASPLAIIEADNEARAAGWQVTYPGQCFCPEHKKEKP